MTCQRCKSERILSINAKCSDLCFVSIMNEEHDGYVPMDIGMDGGDYVDFSYCLECGQIQGTFPLPLTRMEQGKSEDDEDEDDDIILTPEEEARVTLSMARDNALKKAGIEVNSFFECGGGRPAANVYKFKTEDIALRAAKILGKSANDIRFDTNWESFIIAFPRS